MIRRRRLTITPGPGRTLPDPDDPSLPQVAPRQPTVEPPLPPAEPPPPPPRPDDEPHEVASADPADTWLRCPGLRWPSLTSGKSRRADRPAAL